ncbi:hypothetical protein KUCAC02_017139, partial [Chaenocephalus aceratus]
LTPISPPGPSRPKPQRCQMVNQCPVRHTKNGPLQLTIRLISRDSKQTSAQHRSSAPREHPLQLKTIQKM